jgi:hypothetical protein
MTWIIKAPNEACPYSCHPKAEVFAPHQWEAYRFKSRRRAKRVADRQNAMAPDDNQLVVVRLLRRCPIRGECPRHGFVHGAEAEELRSGIEKLLERGCLNYPMRLRELLDRVDARDSLAFVVELNAPCSTRAEGK